MRKIILTEDKLRSIVKESVIRICEEYYSTRKQGKHTYHKLLDDEDFMYIVNQVLPYTDGASKEEIIENENEIKWEIEDFLNEVLNELAKDNLGYKYGNIPYGNKMGVVSDIFEYIVENT